MIMIEFLVGWGIVGFVAAIFLGRLIKVGKGNYDD